MTPVQIINKKRDGLQLSLEEIKFLVNGYVNGSIPDYQVAAFLMAVYFQGMTFEETANLTKAMLNSGETIDQSSIPGPKVDKHSTGGVGDKVSLVLAPLVAAAGASVPMISGRALGHTGGTLDKLEAIPGFRTNLSVEELQGQVAQIGLAMSGQTEQVVPADKRIYSLRDSTATVNSIPLITASILSKKLAEGIDGLVLDVKVGQGAFFKDEEQSLKLARSLIATGENFGLKTVALLTAMDQPLGKTVGNWLETKEAIEALRGQGPSDLMEVVMALGGIMLMLANRACTIQEGIEKLSEVLKSGSAYEKFLELVKAQGGDVQLVEKPDRYPRPRYSSVVESHASGFVQQIDALEIGLVAMALGAGRTKMDDVIDYGAGIVLNKKVGDRVESGEHLAVLFTNRKLELHPLMERIRLAFSISPQPPEKGNTILKMVNSEGEKRW